MSYVFWPPRTENYAPPGMPYLAGLRGMRGLGDYAADLTAYKMAMLKYQRDMVAWNAEKKKYDAALVTYATTVSSINASYASEQADYQRDLASWNKEYAMYLLAVSAWNSSVSQIKSSNAQRALTIAQGWGVTQPFPSWFVNQGYCLSQAQIDSYAKQCTTVKGLGHLGYRGLGSNDSDCGWKRMPLCNFPAKPTVRGKPSAPSEPKYPAKPKLRAQPVAPTAPTATAPSTPSSGGGTKTPDSGSPGLSPNLQPSPDPATVPVVADADASGGMMRNGLIIVALGVGGYLVYRTLKKPKAQA